MDLVSRRAFLLGSTATALAGLCAPAARAAQAAAGSEAAQARAIYDSVFERMLEISPEMATGLGLDTGARGPQTPADR